MHEKLALEDKLSSYFVNIIIMSWQIHW